MWKMGYASYENFKIMNATFNEIPNWNWGSEEYIVYTPDYWEDYKQYTPYIKLPVLFYYGKSDWNIGPEHYKGINFPNMILWGSDVGHMPFMKNKEDLEKAIIYYKKK
jgi:proline iminopeptidase